MISVGNVILLCVENPKDSTTLSTTLSKMEAKKIILFTILKEGMAYLGMNLTEAKDLYT